MSLNRIFVLSAPPPFTLTLHALATPFTSKSVCVSANVFLGPSRMKTYI